MPITRNYNNESLTVVQTVKLMETNVAKIIYIRPLIWYILHDILNNVMGSRDAKAC